MAQEANQTALDHVPTGAQLTACPYPWLTALSEGVYTSLDLRSPAGRKAFIACQQDDCLKLDGLINTEISVTDVLVHPASSERDEGGEIDEWQRAVMFLADGRMVACGSQGVLKSLRLAAIAYGKPPWRPGLRATVLQRAIGDNKRWYVLQWDMEQDLADGLIVTPKTGTAPKNTGASPKSR